MQVIKTTCDFCPEALEPKPATGAVQIDNMLYDVCDDCKKEMQDLLKGKGRAAVFNPGILQPNAIPSPFYPPVLPPQPAPLNPLPGTTGPYIGDPPYHQWPTIICQNTCKAEGTSNANPR